MTPKLSAQPGVIPPCPAEPGFKYTAANIFDHGRDQETEKDRKQKVMLYPLRPPDQ